MKKDLFNFSDFDDSIVENIADNYPDMNKSQQKAICRKTRKKLILSDDSAMGDVVSGIEIARKRNPWYICGTVAAAVFAVAFIPTAFKALKNAPDGPENIQGPPAVDMATAPVEDEEKSMAAVTTKIGDSDIITVVTTSVNNTEVPAPTQPTTAETEDKGETNDTVPPPPPVTEGKKTTSKTLRTTVPQTPPAPTSAPAVSTPVTTTKPVTVPPAPPAVSEDGIFDILANLSYRQETCDGTADYILQANDGTTYQILTGCNHVWRRGRSGYQEADLTPEILEWIKKYGEPYKVKAHSATAEVDWCMNEFSGDVWNVIRKGYSAVVRNTGELREYLAKIYPETKVEAYLEQYNDSYFKDYVLALNAVTQGRGTENKLYISDLNMSDSEINITTEWHWNEVEAEVLSICLVKVNIPKHMYGNQDINWNITKESSVVNNQATAEIDWRYYDFINSNDYDDGLVNGIWENEYSDNWIITNTEELQNVFSNIYDENVIEEYREKYNDEFFDNNVLLSYLYCVPNGRDDKIYMKDIEISDSEININAIYKITGRGLFSPYVCVIYVTVPKEIYIDQNIYWNISEQFKIQ